MEKVVLDTNIIISAAISDKGNPFAIINLVSEGIADRVVITGKEYILF